MQRIPLPIMIVMLGLVGTLAADAQTYVTYHCRDGSEVSAVSFSGERRIHLQLDGRALTLPRRIAIRGDRYSGSGVSFWIVKGTATLRRGGRSTTCTPY